MGRKLPVTVIIIGLVGAVYLVASLALSNFLSQERLRVMLVEPVADQLGRQVEFGSIKVSLFSGIDIKDIVVKEKDPTQNFVAIGDFRLKYELLPLLKRRLVINEVLIDQPVIRISRNAQGVFNFADLSLGPKNVQKEIPPPELQTVEPLPLALVFKQIKINNLNLTFNDQTGALPTITSSKGDLVLAVSLGKTLADATYQGSLELLVNTEFQGSKPVLLLKGAVSNQLLTFKGEAHVEFDKLLLSGQLANPMTAPDLTLDFQGQTLDLGAMSRLKPTEQGASSQAAAATLPAVSSQTGGKKFRIQGQIDIKELHRGKLALTDLGLHYTFSDNVLTVTGFSAGLFGGLISGKAGVELGRPAPAFRGQIKADKLQMAAVMVALDKPQGYLTGQLSADFSGRGEGRGWPTIRDSLDGQGRLSVVKGGLASAPVSQALAALLGMPELDNLRFDRLSATAKIAGGRAALDVNLASKLLTIQSKGSAGLDGSLDLPLVLRLSPEYSQRLQEKAAFSRYLADPAGRTTLNLQLSGSIDQPELRLNGAGVGNQIKNALVTRAGEELGRALAKKKGAFGKQRPGATEETTDRLLQQLLDN